MKWIHEIPTSSLNYYEQMITNNTFKCIDLPYSEILNSFVLKVFALHELIIIENNWFWHS